MKLGDEVTVHMNATPQQVWALVSDVTQIGRYSPETFEGEWLDGATGPAVGVRFRGHVKRNQKGPTYWAKCYVTASEPGKEFSFGVGEPGKAAINWRAGRAARIQSKKRANLRGRGHHQHRHQPPASPQTRP